MTKKLSENIFNRALLLLEKYWEMQLFDILHIPYLDNLKKVRNFTMLFDHCFEDDILEGSVSSEEIEFVKAGQKFYERLHIDDQNLSEGYVPEYCPQDDCTDCPASHECDYKEICLSFSKKYGLR